MKYYIGLLLLAVVFCISSFTKKNNFTVQQPYSDTVHFPGETHFANVRQLTFGGDNDEAYLSKEGKYLIFQKTDPKNGIMCEQI